MEYEKDTSKYSYKKREKIIKIFCRRMEKWESINDICKFENIRYDTIKYRVDSDEYFSDLWTNSKNLYMENKIRLICEYISSRWISLISAAAKCGIAKSTIYKRINNHEIYKELIHMAYQWKASLVETARFKQILAWNTRILIKEMTAMYPDEYR